MGQEKSDAERNSEAAGPYRIQVGISNVLGGSFYTNAEASLTTANLTNANFQGNLLNIISISDSLIDRGQTIRFTASIQAEIAGTYNLSGYLFKETDESSVSLGANNLELYLTTGNNQVQFDFDAKKMKGEGVSGPYDLVLYAADAFYESNKHHVSQAYQLNQLAAPAVCFNGALIIPNQAGMTTMSTNSSTFTVMVPLMVGTTGNYIIAASIWDKDCISMVDGMIMQETLTVGSRNVQLVFNIDKISEYNLTGPFNIFILLLDQNENLLFSRNEDIDNLANLSNATVSTMASNGLSSFFPVSGIVTNMSPKKKNQ